MKIIDRLGKLNNYKLLINYLFDEFEVVIIVAIIRDAIECTAYLIWFVMVLDDSSKMIFNYACLNYKVKWGEVNEESYRYPA